jgi:hypothetical protein
MIEWINKLGVKSSKGFIFQSKHRFYYHYIENDHIMVIYVEGTFDKQNNYTLLLNSSSFDKWETPYENEIVDDKKKEEIKNNIIDALKFMKYNYEFT